MRVVEGETAADDTGGILQLQKDGSAHPGIHSFPIAAWRPQPPAPPNRTFFFQAEDGIRDADVTGVQTCALPISSSDRCRRPDIETGVCCGWARGPTCP